MSVRRIGKDNPSGIYSIIINGEQYIGSAMQGCQYRFQQHLYALRKNDHHNKKVQNAYNKYGEESLVFSIIEVVIDKSIILEREQYYLDLLSPSFNICKIAGNTAGREYSKETILKMRLAQLGEKNWNYGKRGVESHSFGKKQSEESNQKRSKSGRGRTFSEEHKKKISVSLTGLKRSPEFCHTISERNKQRPKEFYEKLANLRRGTKTNPKQKENNRKIHLLLPPIKNKYKGVRERKDLKTKKYCAIVGHNGKQLHLGYYRTEEEAAQAYDKKQYELNGINCYFNFPERLVVSEQDKWLRTELI